ncbi:Cytochrome P450, putative [Theobroma cacao]|uniref:Cytochrome P450, putative n=1 Tax=Theobroma cacao TaxID=3641 RepID=A0A061FDF8_THECC|nr:Cytochrome P450, putative [Theobroma cacao]
MSLISGVGLQKFSYIGSDVALSPYNAYWRETKKVFIVHLLNSNRVQLYRPIREEEVSKTIEKISNASVDSKPINLSEAMIRLTSTIICRNVFLAGRDKSSVAIVRVMTFLMNPRSMKRAQEEVRNLIGKKGFADENDIQSLFYLKAVVKETFRLQPVVPLLIPQETIRKSNIGNYEIPAKTLVYVSAWAIGRDPEVWENPESFCPERFLVVELGLANLLHKFDWDMPDGIIKEDWDLDVNPGLTMFQKNDLC